MRPKLLSLFAAAVFVAALSSTRKAEAQVAIGGTFAGPHGVVSFNTGYPYAPYPSGYYSGYHRYPRYSTRYSYAPGYAYYPRRYRVRRFFVAFPYPHYVVRRVYYRVDPYCRY